MADCKTACPNFAGFCYKNAWHWYVLVVTIPFAVRGIGFILHLADGVGTKVAQ